MNEDNDKTKTVETEVVPEILQRSLLPATQSNPPSQLVQQDPLAKHPITAAQAKVDAIADLTHSAYQKAGTLNLAKEESDQLQAEFPDEAFKSGAAGKENLIYIEHAFLRDRFIKVFGMGAWAIIPRNRWEEKFTIPARPGKDAVDCSRVYVEAMLIVRGCFVAEAIGEMEYYPKNAAQNYGDAVEGASTAAFRRCAKGFGVGLQAWKKDWCEGWWARKRASMSQNRTPSPTPAARQNAPGSTGQPAGTAIATPRPQATVAPPRVATEAASKAVVKMPTADTRKWMIEQLRAGPGQQNEKIVVEYFGKVGQIMPNEIAEELPLRFVPFSKQELEALINCISNFEAGGDVVRAFEPHGEAEEKPIEVPRDSNIDHNSPDAPWRSFPMPWGKKAGVALADLEKNYLFGLFANYKVETEYNGKPKKPEAIAKDKEFRAMLDEAGRHYEFQKKD